MISVITPVYNTARYLRQCIDSLLAQTYTDWEMILVDDGSTDESFEILREYEKIDSRIRVFTQVNSGPSEARNVGLREMRGEYVTFLDSDDWFDSNTLESAWKAVEDTNADMVLWNFKRYENGSFRNATHNIPISGYHGIEDTRKYAEDFVYNLDGKQYMPTLWIRMIRTDVIRKSGLFFDVTLKRSEDVIFLCELNYHLNSFYSIPDGYFTVYRSNPDSIVHGYVDGYIDMIDTLINTLKCNPVIMESNNIDERVYCIYMQRLRILVTQEIQKHRKSIITGWRAVKDILNKKQIQDAIDGIEYARGVALFGKAFVLLRLGLKLPAYLIMYIVTR